MDNFCGVRQFLGRLLSWAPTAEFTALDLRRPFTRADAARAPPVFFGCPFLIFPTNMSPLWNRQADAPAPASPTMKVFKIEASRPVAECQKNTDRHATTARQAAAFVRDEVDSPMETRLRMLIVLAGLPEPEVNHKIRDENGRVLIRLGPPPLIGLTRVL